MYQNENRAKALKWEGLAIITLSAMLVGMVGGTVYTHREGLAQGVVNLMKVFGG
jgi:hypothetical protein